MNPGVVSAHDIHVILVSFSVPFLHQGSNLDSNAKMWRLVADFMNDLGNVQLNLNSVTYCHVYLPLSLLSSHGIIILMPSWIVLFYLLQFIRCSWKLILHKIWTIQRIPLPLFAWYEGVIYTHFVVCAGMFMDLLSPLFPSSLIYIMCLGSISRSFSKSNYMLSY